MKDFSPFGLIPSTVGLTVYHGQAWDLPASVLQDVLDAVTAGAMSVPIAGVFSGLEHVPARTARSIPTRCPVRTWWCWAEAFGWYSTYVRSRRRATSACLETMAGL